MYSDLSLPNARNQRRIRFLDSMGWNPHWNGCPTSHVPSEDLAAKYCLLNSPHPSGARSLAPVHLRLPASPILLSSPRLSAHLVRLWLDQIHSEVEGMSGKDDVRSLKIALW